MKKIFLSLFVAAGLATAGMSVAAAFAPASAGCHDKSSSRTFVCR